MRYHAIPLELSEANALVAKWHRHHQPCQGHRFSLGVVDGDGELHGAAIVGRPVARLAGSPRDVLEVVRLVTDGKVRRTDQPTEAKRRWAKSLADRPDLSQLPDRATKRGEQTADLFGGVA